MTENMAVSTMGLVPGFDAQGKPTGEATLEEKEAAAVKALPEGHDRIMTRADVMTATTLGVVKEYIPIMKACVYLRVMTQQEFWEYQEWYECALKERGEPIAETGEMDATSAIVKEGQARYAAIVLSDEKGNREWTDDEWNEIAKRYSPKALKDIHELGKMLNSNTLEDAEKN